MGMLDTYSYEEVKMNPYLLCFILVLNIHNHVPKFVTHSL